LQKYNRSLEFSKSLKFLEGALINVIKIITFSTFIVVVGNLFHPLLTSAFTFVTSAKVDLNKDGRVETIAISDFRDTGEFLLKINGISTTGRLNEGRPDGFTLVDIDKRDAYTEIAVHTPGASDDDEYLIFWYDGRTISEMGRLSRWPKFLGNGIVHVDGWMGFWTKKEKYLLDKNSRILHKIPQELYYVGVKAFVKESFTIQATRESSKILAKLRPQSNILILLCDTSPECRNKDGEADNYFCDWYLIKSVTGLVGWARLGSFWKKVEGLPWAD
jgi:hypothetical protein